MIVCCFVGSLCFYVDVKGWCEKEEFRAIIDVRSPHISARQFMEYIVPIRRDLPVDLSATLSYSAAILVPHVYIDLVTELV